MTLATVKEPHNTKKEELEAKKDKIFRNMLFLTANTEILADGLRAFINEYTDDGFLKEKIHFFASALNHYRDVLEETDRYIRGL